MLWQPLEALRQPHPRAVCSQPICKPRPCTACCRAGLDQQEWQQGVLTAAEGVSAEATTLSCTGHTCRSHTCACKSNSLLDVIPATEGRALHIATCTQLLFCRLRQHSSRLIQPPQAKAPPQSPACCCSRHALHASHRPAISRSPYPQPSHVWFSQPGHESGQQPPAPADAALGLGLS